MPLYGGSPSSLSGGLPKIPCARCERLFPLAKWGDLCPECFAERRRRATRVSQRVALVATALLALYITLRLPTAAGHERIWAAVAVVAIYLIVRRIAMSVAMEYMRR